MLLVGQDHGALSMCAYSPNAFDTADTATSEAPSHVISPGRQKNMLIERYTISYTAANRTLTANLLCTKR